ncbi:hybrid sensor histidine kinase/response regulator transcription factor [Spirosoma gilvum]
MLPVLLYYHRTLKLIINHLPLLLVLVSSGCIVAQSVSIPQPENITSRQGLPQAFVPSIVQDKQGFIWMATRDGLCRYDGNHFKVFQPSTDGRPGIASSSLFGLKVDQKGRIWVFSDRNDVDIVDPVKETFRSVSQQPFFKKAFANEVIDAHFIDNKGRLWLSFLSDKIVCFDSTAQHFQQYKRPPIPGYFPTFSLFAQDQQGTIWMVNKTGLYRFDQQAGGFSAYSLPDNETRGIYTLTNGDLFIPTRKSVLLLNPATGQIQTFPLPAQTDNETDWHHTRITVDSQGNIYFGQYNILFRFSPAKTIDVFARLGHQTSFRGLFVDQSDVLWVGTDRIGVLKYNLKANLFRALPYQYNFYYDLFIRHLGVAPQQLPDIPKGVSVYNVRYNFDQAGKLWFNFGTSLLYQFDLSTKQITSIPFPLKLPVHYTWADPVMPMSTDPAGRVWAVTDSLAMSYQNNQWKQFPYPIRTRKTSGGVEGQILQVVADAQALWMITSSQGLYRVDLGNGQIRSFKHQPDNPASITSNQLFCLFADPQESNILWIGTFGSGLCRFDKRTGLCRRFSVRDGLPNNVIYFAIPDQHGFLWIGTNQGLCRMDLRTYQTRTYTHEDGLLEDEFNRFHFIHLPDGRIVLGGLNGTTSFFPSQLGDDTYHPAIQITDIQINNHSLSPGPLTDSLPAQAINRLTLSYDQNFITVAFAALQYNRQAKIRYRYQLEGLDEDWVETNQPLVHYTDLGWGTYRLKLNASNTAGIWSDNIRLLTLTIRPPWWATWWAILLYIAGLLAIIYVLIRSYLHQQEAKQLKEIDVIKARFFTNITHEFKTPLMLILAPIETLRQRLQTNEDQQQLDLINQNATQLISLVNQLMELSKAEAHILKLNESQGDLVAFVNQLVQSFEPKAATQGIELVFENENMDSDYWFDHDKLERILSNLVSNALKFTPVGGKISVHLASFYKSYTTSEPTVIANRPAWVRLTVRDNGLGITPDKLPFIFNRFYQIDAPDTPVATDSDNQYLSQKGMGIGLALVKELIEFQSGTIQVESTTKAGTVFTVELPYRSSPSSTSPFLPLSEQPATNESEPDSKIEVQTEEITSDKAPVIVVVEDHTVLREFIISCLPSSYQIHQAANGQEGLELALSLMPDMVISDVLMPVMDGYTLCDQLKKDPQTSHIPVILLTAKSSVDSRLEGLALGADDYIAKPFHVQEFRLRVRNLLEQRRQLKRWFLASLTSPEPLSNAPAPTDPLIERLCQIIEQHLDDTAFGAEELTVASNMSRMNLHRKLKALTDTSTGEFLRNYRLKRAAQFLRQGYTVSETAYLVGFEDPSYFARSFRKVYNMTPSTFSKRD